MQTVSLGEYTRKKLRGGAGPAEKGTKEDLQIPGWERYKGKITLPFQGQLVRGRWYVPLWGCDSLEHLLEEIGFFDERGGQS